jgi:two-component system cell cycle response regulator
MIAPDPAALVPALPLWRRVLTPPDPLQMDAGAEGELIVARVRSLLIAMLMPIPLINIALDPNLQAGLVGLAVAATALACSLGVQLVLKRDFYRPWIAFATSLLDVTLVSCGLGSFLLLGQPLTTTNSRLLFEVYFVAIGATALRYDARVSLLAGLVAILQYAALVGAAWFLFDLHDPELDLHGYGTFDWATQLSRLLLLLVMTILAAALILRSQRLRRQSRSDRLTGLPNRSWFDERVEAELSRARRYRQPVALAMIDVDHFKRFNDTYGHAAGDVALRAVAHAIQSTIRQSDLVVRYGGEEFVALFPGMEPAAAVERVEALRRVVEELPLPLTKRNEVAHVTISAGVAIYGLDGTQAEDLLDCADARLFQAKNSGRNRVVGPRLTPQTGTPAVPAEQSSGPSPNDLPEHNLGE